MATPAPDPLVEPAKPPASRLRPPERDAREPDRRNILLVFATIGLACTAIAAAILAIPDKAWPVDPSYCRAYAARATVNPPCANRIHAKERAGA
jgi:hypothetical protein